MSNFWSRAEKCKHENTRDTDYFGVCGTPYCGTISEEHCLDCGAFITRCRCGNESGMSGWPALRWARFYRGKEKAWRAKWDAIVEAGSG